MTKAQHTQGPWNVSKPNCGLGIFDVNGKSVAAISSNQSRSWEEKEANARLIASAPELLEALKASRAVLKSVIGTIDEMRIIKEQIDLIDKAIAKAEGR